MRETSKDPKIVLPKRSTRAAHRARWVFGYLVAWVLLFFVGCSSEGPPCAPVTGKVTFGGAPVTAGTVTFYPKSGRAAIGKIGADGVYQLTTITPGDGAIIGSHAVTIEATAATGPPPPASFEDEQRLSETLQPSGPATVTWLVPPEYADRATSKLTAEVVAGQNQIDFALPAK